MFGDLFWGHLSSLLVHVAPLVLLCEKSLTMLLHSLRVLYGFSVSCWLPCCLHRTWTFFFFLDQLAWCTALVFSFSYTSVLSCDKVTSENFLHCHLLNQQYSLRLVSLWKLNQTYISAWQLGFKVVSVVLAADLPWPWCCSVVPHLQGWATLRPTLPAPPTGCISRWPTAGFVGTACRGKRRGLGPKSEGHFAVSRKVPNHLCHMCVGSWYSHAPWVAARTASARQATLKQVGLKLRIHWIFFTIFCSVKSN